MCHQDLEFENIRIFKSKNQRDHLYILPLTFHEHFLMFLKIHCNTLREAFKKKNSKKSDIVTKGRVGWNPNPYF